MRVIDDEAIYYYHVKELAFSSKGVERAPFGHLIMSFFLRISKDFMCLRFFNSIAVLGILLLLNNYSGIFGVFLFSTTFSSLRWASRINLETFGTFLFLIGLVNIKKNRTLSTIGFVLAALTRESFILPLIVYAIYFKKEIKNIIVLAFCVLIINSFLTEFEQNEHSYKESSNIPVLNTIISHSKILITNILFSKEFYVRNAQNVVEFLFISPLQMLLLFHLLKKRNAVTSIVCSQAFVLLFLTGFIVNGPFERYTIPLTASLSLVSKDFFKKNQKLIILFMILKITFLSTMVPYFSTSGSESVYEIGLKDDRFIIGILKNENNSKFIIGHHAALFREKNWRWVGRNVTEMINLKPDIIVTYPSWIQINNSTNIEIQEIGRYFLINSKNPEHLGQSLQPAKKNMWKYKGEFLAE